MTPNSGDEKSSEIDETELISQDEDEEFDKSKAFTTLIISGRKRRVLRDKATDESMLPHGQRELILVIRGMVERVPLPPNGEIILGRLDPKASPYADRPDVDLTPYGALERGVSRLHARLHVEDSQVFLTDLDSTNGTFLADKRLEGDVPTQLKTGTEFLLGRLALQVLFR